MPQHHAGVTQSIERSDRDIGPVGDEAEAREEAEQVGPGASRHHGGSPERQGRHSRGTGPDQTTSNGLGLSARSVREMVSGCSTTRATCPPLHQAPTTWPNSWRPPACRAMRPPAGSKSGSLDSGVTSLSQEGRRTGGYTRNGVRLAPLFQVYRQVPLRRLGRGSKKSWRSNGEPGTANGEPDMCASLVIAHHVPRQTRMPRHLSFAGGVTSASRMIPIPVMDAEAGSAESVRRNADSFALPA